MQIVEEVEEHDRAARIRLVDADADSKVVAWGDLYSSGSIWAVGTDPDYRRQGLATRVMTRLVELARERGYKRIYLNATWAGYQVYRKLGWYVDPTDVIEGFPPYSNDPADWDRHGVPRMWYDLA